MPEPNNPHTTPSRPASCRTVGAQGRDVVPMAVWPCITPAGRARPAGVMPPLLARRLLAAYTRPGDVVLAAGAGSSTIAEAAAAAGRRPVLDQADPPRVFPALGTGRAALAVITTPAVCANPDRYTRWARALAPGGLLAAVLLPGFGPAAMRPGQVIAAAAGAGLGYLQHLIAVLARLDTDRLRPVPTRAQLARTRAARGAGLPVHLPIHADVVILTRPPQPEPADPPAPHPPRQPCGGDHRCLNPTPRPRSAVCR